MLLSIQGGIYGMSSPVFARRVVATAVGALVLVLAVCAAAPAAEKKVVTHKVTATSALTALVSQTNAISSSSIPSIRKIKLLRLAHHARSVVVRTPCASVKDLNAFRLSLKATRLRPSVRGSKRGALRRRLSQLGATSLTASGKLLASATTKKCGGGIKPNTLAAPKTKVLKSDINGMTVHVELPALNFVPRVAGNETFTELKAPNTDSPGAAGTPAIPVDASTLGVPDGATMTVKASSVQSYTVDGVNVYPNQPPPLDQAPTTLTSPPDFTKAPFIPPPFQLDKKAYHTKGMVPAAPADGVVLGQSRDITVGSLQIPTAQYDPVTDQLKVLTGVDVQVVFNGGAKSFNPYINSPYETAQHSLALTLLNSSVIGRFNQRDHLAPVRRADARHHQPLDAHGGEHAVRRAQRRRHPDPRRPDRHGDGQRRHDRAPDPGLHPRPADDDEPVLRPPELRRDHR